MIGDNYLLYESRKEPEVLARMMSGRALVLYPTIRDIDGNSIRELLQELSALGSSFVLMSWVSPPYGRVVGYGMYKKNEAEAISHRSQSERWGFPQAGRIYTKKSLEDRLKDKSQMRV